MQLKDKTRRTDRSIATAIVEALDGRQLMSAAITGFLVADNNANYSWDTGDTRNIGWRAYVDANNNRQFDDGEASALSDATGRYRIERLDAGTHRVRQVLPAGWRQTFPSNADYTDVAVADGEMAPQTSAARRR